MRENSIQTNLSWGASAASSGDWFLNPLNEISPLCTRLLSFQQLQISPPPPQSASRWEKLSVTAFWTFTQKIIASGCAGGRTLAGPWTSRFACKHGNETETQETMWDTIAPYRTGGAMRGTDWPILSHNRLQFPERSRVSKLNARNQYW